jgi:succinate dehydrogenase / fumarate reductase, cytochrome b subunit
LATQSSPLPRPALRAPRSYFSTSVGTKVLVGATGLLLFLYLILHLAGNLLLFLGPETFNEYSHLLISNPLVIPVEIGLAAIFLIHAYKAVTNFLANRRARPVGYHKYTWTRGGVSRKGVASSTMILSGIVVFVFVLVHLYQFKYGPEYLVAQAEPGGAGAEIRDLYRLEVEVFSNVLNVVFYLFCMVVVGSHLWHGIASAFESLGASHPRYTPWVFGIGKVLAFVVTMGFLVIPPFVFFFLRPASG